MAVNPNNAAQVINASRVQKQYRQKVDCPTIPGTTYLGNTSSTDLSRAWPIDYLLVKFTGVLAVATATMTDLHPFGALNVIKKFTIKSNGKDAIIDLPGYLLQYVSDIFTNNPSYTSHPAKTTGNNAFAYYFRIPLNPGPGMLGLFDPTSLRSLTLEVQWGTAADIASGAGTAIVSSANLDVSVIHVAGLGPKVLGGRGYGYPLHIIETQTYTLTGSNSAFPIDYQLRHQPLRTVAMAKRRRAHAPVRRAVPLRLDLEAHGLVRR